MGRYGALALPAQTPNSQLSRRLLASENPYKIKVRALLVYAENRQQSWNVLKKLAMPISVRLSRNASGMWQVLTPA